VRLAIVTVLVLCGLFAPLLAPHSPIDGSLGERLVPPLGMKGSKASHPLGTDRLGRDTLSRLLLRRPHLPLGVGSLGVMSSMLRRSWRDVNRGHGVAVKNLGPWPDGSARFYATTPS